jgi:hypothetical protein
MSRIRLGHGGVSEEKIGLIKFLAKGSTSIVRLVTTKTANKCTKNMHFKTVQRPGLEYPSQYSSEKCHDTKLRVCSLQIWSIYTFKTSFPLCRTIYVSMCLGTACTG